MLEKSLGTLQTILGLGGKRSEVMFSANRQNGNIRNEKQKAAIELWKVHSTYVMGARLCFNPSYKYHFMCSYNLSSTYGLCL